MPVMSMGGGLAFKICNIVTCNLVIMMTSIYQKFFYNNNNNSS